MADDSSSGGNLERDASLISIQDSSSGMTMLEPDQIAGGNLNEAEEFVAGNLSLFGENHSKGKLHDVEDDGVPRAGMVFKTFEDVYDFYNQYARRLGFGTKIRRSWYSLEDGQCNKFMLTCCKEGKREYKNSERCSSYRLRLAARTDCQARVKVFKKYSDGMFHLTEVNLEHNHPVNPSMSRFFRSHKDLNDGARKLPVIRGKGHRDVHLADNELEYEHSSLKTRPSFLGKDDLEALHQFFTRMQISSMNFFHLMDLDDDGRLKNVFWADSRCKVAYQYFGDVVTFDTTYLTLNYEIPLVSFVGVNNHGHLVLFGCGLISDRSVGAFRWLFKSWLSCMSGSCPSAIITDNVSEIQEAVSEIFPSSRHRFCLSSTMKQLQENLGAYPEYKAIKGTMKKVVYDSLSAVGFEEGWRIMIERYTLEDNEWLRSLFESRHLWVPAFVKESFWAGTSSSQHKLNTDLLFDGSIYPKTSLKQFICKYESILRCKFEKEVAADRDSFHKNPQLISKFYMEDQLRKLYTVDMFKKFQEEVKAILYCIPSLVRVDGLVSIFEVKEPLRLKNGNHMENKNYKVTYYANELEIKCVCCSFQMTGILCRHALSVFNFLEIYEIPAHYIVERWRKDYKSLRVLPAVSNDLGANGPADRYDNLYRHCLKFIELGAVSDGLYEYALKVISEGTNELFASDPTASDIRFRTFNPFSNDKRASEDENVDMHYLSELRQRSQPLRKRKELAEKTVKSNKKKVPPRKSIATGQNDVIRMAQETPQFDAHIWTHDSICIADQVSPPTLSIGSHFGVHMSQQHPLDSQAGIRWSFQHMFQPHPDGPPGPWSG